LLGESFSGPLALLAAVQRPKGLIGVILCASFCRSPHPYVPQWFTNCFRPSLLRLMPVAGQIKALTGGYGSIALRQLTKHAIATVSQRVLAHRLRATLTIDATAALQDCPVPLLYLRGARDRWVVPGWNVATIRQLLPTAKVSVIDAPHMVLQTHPQEAAAAIAEFQATLSNTPPPSNIPPS
jgi:pimeloyl-ACP methyl ester carboxylesterase